MTSQKFQHCTSNIQLTSISRVSRVSSAFGKIMGSSKKSIRYQTRVFSGRYFFPRGRGRERGTRDQGSGMLYKCALSSFRYKNFSGNPPLCNTRTSLNDADSRRRRRILCASFSERILQSVALLCFLGTGN